MIDQAMRRVRSHPQGNGQPGLRQRLQPGRAGAPGADRRSKRRRFEELERERRDYLRQKFGPATNARLKRLDVPLSGTTRRTSQSPVSYYDK